MLDATDPTDLPADVPTDDIPGPVATLMTFNENLDGLPDPNGHPNMTGEILPDDWEPTDGDR